MKQMTAVRMALCSLFTALIAIGAFLQIPTFCVQALGFCLALSSQHFAAAGLCSMGKENGRHAFWLYWQDCWQPMESDLLINM